MIPAEADAPSVDAPNADAIAPRLVSSEPAQGAVDVYPARMFEGMAPRVRVVLRFDEPMDRERAVIEWGPAGGARQSLAGVWSDGGAELVADITAPPLTGQQPLADRTAYEIDVRGLRDASGNAVDPGALLDDGLVRFTTGAYDELLNHSCGHVFFGPYATATAAAAPGPVAARTDTAHTRYTVNLPASGDGFAGYVRLRAGSAATWHLFLDGDPGIALETPAGDALPIAIAPTPDACTGIAQRATFHVAQFDERFLKFGPAQSASVKFIVEVVTDQ